MPRIPRVEPADTVHDRILASLRGAAPVVDDESAGGTAEESGDDTTNGKVSSPSPAPASTADVRAWAKDQGLDVSDAGPIPKAVREAYDDAHAG